MEMNPEVQKEIANLQVMEQRANSITMQKQTLQSQLLETENAIIELKNGEESYKVIGGVIVSIDKNSLNKELQDKIESLKTKVTTLDKEESKIRTKLEERQEGLMKKLK